MLNEIKGKLENEIRVLKHELAVELPNRIETALELGDLRENSEYKAAKERQSFVEARLGQLTSRVTELAKIDLGELPQDRVGFGSRVSIRDAGTGTVSTFTITAGDFIDLDAGQISMDSPIGRALLGAAEGDEVAVHLPNGVRRYRVLNLKTLQHQLDG